MPFLRRSTKLVGPFGGLPFVGREFLRRRGNPLILLLIVSIVI